MRRRTIVGLTALTLPLLAVPAAAGGWFWARTAVDQGWHAWADARRAEGYTVEHAEPEFDGFPTGVRVRLPALRVEAPSGWAWKAPTITGEAPLTSPLDMRLRAPGPHTITRPSGAAYRLRAETARGRVKLTPSGDVARGRARLETASLTLPPLGDADAESVRLRANAARTGSPPCRSGRGSPG